MSTMTTRVNVKGFSSAPQQSSLEKDTKNYNSANETGVPDGKDFGTFLNELTDPNYVPPEKMRRVGKKELDKDAFMQLMLAQIKNQDPLNPTKSDQMAAQLAQFTSVEQLMNMNQKMDGLQKSQTPVAQYQALNFIGRSVAADSSKILRNVGDKVHDVRFTLMKEADNVTVRIKNEQGEVVKKYELGKTKKGEAKITWNGLDEASNSQRAGNYYTEVEATDARGAKIAARTAFEGRVTGVNYTADGVVLMVGDQSVRLNDVTKIEDPDLKSDQKAKDAQPALIQSTQNMKNENEALEGAKPNYTGNIDSIPMAQQVWDEKNAAREGVGSKEPAKDQKSGS